MNCLPEMMEAEDAVAELQKGYGTKIFGVCLLPRSLYAVIHVLVSNLYDLFFCDNLCHLIQHYRCKEIGQWWR